LDYDALYGRGVSEAPPQYEKVWGKTHFHRIEEMKDKKGKVIDNLVVEKGFGANDINQGSIGDCWFLSALSVVSHNRPELLKRLIHEDTRELGNKGNYILRFYKARKQKIVMVDDFFPCISEKDKRSLFCQLAPNDEGFVEFWPLLFEKAYAKIHNGYVNLDGGRPEHAIVDLTNGISENIVFEEEEFEETVTDGSFWTKLESAAKNRHLMCSSSQGKSDANINENGIVEAHAYSVLDV